MTDAALKDKNFTRAIVIASIGKSKSEVVAGLNERDVYSHKFSLGSQTMDTAIIEHFRQNLGLLIGKRTSEAIRIALGSASPEDDTLTMDVRGRDVEERVPRLVTVNEAEISAAILEVVAEIVGEIQTAVDRVFAETQTEIEHFGVVLKGEGGWLRGLDKRVSVATKLFVVVSDEAYEE